MEFPYFDTIINLGNFTPYLKQYNISTYGQAEFYSKIPKAEKNVGLLVDYLSGNIFTTIKDRFLPLRIETLLEIFGSMGYNSHSTRSYTEVLE